MCWSARPSGWQRQAGRDYRPIASFGPEWRQQPIASTGDSARRVTVRSFFLEARHEPADVYRFLRAADLCYVGSLHDGMNLVAKEFVVRARRRAGRAGPEQLCRSGRAAQRRDDRQPVRRRRLGSGPRLRAAHERRGTSEADARDAIRRRRVQHILVGGQMLQDAARVRRDGFNERDQVSGLQFRATRFLRTPQRPYVASGFSRTPGSTRKHEASHDDSGRPADPRAA